MHVPRTLESSPANAGLLSAGYDERPRNPPAPVLASRMPVSRSSSKAPLHFVHQHPLLTGLGILALTALGFAWYWTEASSRANYPTAQYRTVTVEGRFSIREYPALKIARTAGKDQNGSFMKLFRYIQGANVGKEQISMTTPVLMEQGSMSFVLPESHQQSAPAANEQAVEVSTLAARKVAVCTYSGKPEGPGRANSLAELRTWLRSRQQRYREEPIYAVYDGPFTLPWRRLNEVMLPLE